LNLAEAKGKFKLTGLFSAHSNTLATTDFTDNTEWEIGDDGVLSGTAQ
jgi:hypothetical protein